MKKLLLLALTLSLFIGSAAFAQTKTLRIARQYGIGYLPLYVIDEFGLLEKNAKAAGLGEVKIEWLTFAGGAATNEALLSGKIDLNTNGVPPFLVLWDKSGGKVKGLSAFAQSGFILNTSNPKVKTVKDFTTQDKIALPAAKVSIQAILLQMALAKEYGKEHYNKLDGITVTLNPPDAFVSLLSGKSEITGHFSSEPFSTFELQNPNIHTVLDSKDVVGKGFTSSIISTTEKFYDNNKELVAVFLHSLTEACDWLNTHNEKEAADVFLKVENIKGYDRAVIEKILKEIAKEKYTIKPTDLSVYGDFMYETGTLKKKPKFNDLFFDEVFKNKYR